LNADTVPNDTAKTIALIGAPIGAGAGIRGCAMGPAALRTVDIQATLEELGHTVFDQGDIAISTLQSDNSPRTRNLIQVASLAQGLSAATFRALESNLFPVILGGDHSLAMGSVNGVARHCAKLSRELFVLWLDAHADFNTPATSPSGNMHGMSLAMLSGEPGLEAVMGDEPRVQVKPENIHLFGIRSVDREERKLLSARGIHIADMRHINEFGVVSPLKQILETVRAANGLLHVSLDIDFLDPAVAAAVGTTVPGGATYREAHLIMEMLHESGLVCSLDIVELNPILDERGKSARVLVDLAASLFGRKIIDHKPENDRA